MSGLPIAAAAEELGISPSTLRRWITSSGAPVVRRGRQGRGNATLVDIEAMRIWREGGEAAICLELAAAVPDLIAAAMDEALRLSDGPHKIALAGALAGGWYLAATAVVDYLRERCGAVGELTAIPSEIQRLRKIAKRTAQ